MKSEKVEKIVDLAATLASRADEFDQVLVICRMKQVEGKKDGQWTIDNGLTLSEAQWLAGGFMFWLQAGAAGLLKKKEE